MLRNGPNLTLYMTCKNIALVSKLLNYAYMYIFYKAKILSFLNIIMHVHLFNIVVL